jgi:pimeloyl-ACP methyl ester carboxylesterase
MDTLADEIKNVLDAAKVSSCIMIGHSMGGYVTLAFAKKYGHMLSSFGLLHSTAKPDTEERKLKRNQAKRLITEKGASLYARNFIPPLFRPNAPQELITPCIKVVDDFTTEGLSEALMAMKNRKDSFAFLAQTDLPVFWGIGKYDELIPQEDMLKQSLLCKQSYVAYLNKSAHMGHIEESDILAKHIIRFIS